MVDLLETATRQYIRISETGHCHLQIAHNIIGTGRQPRSGTLAMEMGTALEPVIIRQLRSWGFEVAFTGDEQLEVACQDPFRLGHPDGMIWLADPKKMSSYLQSILPVNVLARVIMGEMFMLEVKTMNDASWRKFQRHGLRSISLLDHYIDQVNTYLSTIKDPANDELWPDHLTTTDIHGNPLTDTSTFGYMEDVDNPTRYQYGSDGFRIFLDDIKKPRPSAALVVGFNTAAKLFHFEIVDQSDELFFQSSRDLEQITEALHVGQLPAPSYNGKHADCYWCPFQYCCPAVRALFPEVDIDELSVIAPTRSHDTERIAELAAEYKDKDEEIKAAEARKKEIKIELMRLMEAGDTVLAGGFRVRLTAQNPRRTLNTKELTKLAQRERIELPYNTTPIDPRLNVDRIIGADMDNIDATPAEDEE